MDEWNASFIILLLMCFEMDAKSFGQQMKANEKSGNCNQKHLQSFMWKIKRYPNPSSYLFGTIHVPYTLVWDSIPLHIKRAFERSDCVYFELDLLDPYTIAALSNCQILPNNKKLIDVLPLDLYKRLKRHLDYIRSMLPKWMTADQRGKGLYAEYLFNAITGNWERKRPVWVMLMVNSLTESDIKSRGIPVLDLYLAQEAQRMNKKTGAVEMVEEQCVPMNDLSNMQVLFALNRTLSQHENIRLGLMRPTYTTQDLIHHYNCGNLNAMVFNQDTSQVPSLIGSGQHDSGKDKEIAQRLENYFRSELVIKRNLKMAQKVMEILESNAHRSYFFAFGAGHFIGQNSIIDVLKAAGFEVERVNGEVNINRNASDASFSTTSTKLEKRKGCRTVACVNSANAAAAAMSSTQRRNGRHSSSGGAQNRDNNTGGNGDREKGDKYATPVNNKENNKLNFENGNVGNAWNPKASNDVSSLNLGKSTNKQQQQQQMLNTYSTSLHTSRRTHKKFNDLWVRLEPTETLAKKSRPFIPPLEDVHLTEVRSSNSYTQRWDRSTSSAKSCWPALVKYCLLLHLFAHCVNCISSINRLLL